MSNKRIDEPVSLAVGDIAAALTGIGILVMVLFPLAIPALVLAAALAAPFVVLVAALAVAAALVVGPFLAIRRMARRSAGRFRSRSRRFGRPDRAVDLRRRWVSDQRQHANPIPKGEERCEFS